MKRILITAPTGMLGSMVYNMLKDDYKLVLLYRDETKLELLNKIYGAVSKHKTINFDLLDLQEDYKRGFAKKTIGDTAGGLLKKIGDVDAVINCAGIIKQTIEKNWESALFLNGILPHILSSFYQERLIHITTDCVFNGIERAPYSEKSLHTPNDFYGLSKSIGEPKDASLVLRTSIIGPEITGFVSLLEWVRRQDGKEVDGYRNHFWNGITTKQFALICREIIEHRQVYPSAGLFHIFSTVVTKSEMVKKIAEKYHVNLRLHPRDVFSVDRRLMSGYSLCQDLKIPSFDHMLQAL